MIYKIRTILDTGEDIFRDIEIEDSNNLEEFHNAITQAFGFMGQEMASFYTCNDEWQQEEEIALFSMGNSEGEERFMNDTLLKDVLNENNPKLIYVYDYFSMWTFFVELADTAEKEDGRIYPNLLFQFGELPDSPPEKKFEADGLPPEDSDLDFEEGGFNESWD